MCHSVIAYVEGGVEHVLVARAAEASRVLHGCAARFGGSISAEHGLGQSQREEILRCKSPPEIELVRRIKAARDPPGIMNPGKVLQEFCAR